MEHSRGIFRARDEKTGLEKDNRKSLEIGRSILLSTDCERGLFSHSTKPATSAGIDAGDPRFRLQSVRKSRMALKQPQEVATRHEIQSNTNALCYTNQQSKQTIPILFFHAGVCIKKAHDAQNTETQRNSDKTTETRGRTTRLMTTRHKTADNLNDMDHWDHKAQETYKKDKTTETTRRNPRENSNQWMYFQTVHAIMDASCCDFLSLCLPLATSVNVRNRCTTTARILTMMNTTTWDWRKDKRHRIKEKRCNLLDYEFFHDALGVPHNTY